MLRKSTNSRTAISLAFFVVFFSGVQQAGATLLNISNKPLVLSDSVAPNVILTIDDSGSMVLAVVPDDFDATVRTSRRFKSAAFNPMYYNPSVTYQLPVRVDADGATSSTPYSTSFTAAYANGYDTSKGSTDMSSDYKVSTSYNLTQTRGTTYGRSTSDSRLGENPSSDFGATTISNTNSNPVNSTSNYQSGTITNNSSATSGSFTSTVNGITYTITRGNKSCAATVSGSSSSTSAASVASNTPTAGYTTTTTTTTTTTPISVTSCTRPSNSSTSSYTVSGTASLSTVTNTVVKRLDLTKTGVPAYYYVYQSDLSGCTQSKDDDNCYKLIVVSSSSGKLRATDTASGTDERNNFSIWYSFYRNRALATITAANISMNGLPTTVRLTWQNLNRCTTLNSASSCFNDSNLFREFNGAQRGKFFSWLPKITFSDSTPLRGALTRVGNFISSSNTPVWDKIPGTQALPKYACRPTYHVMMTDGRWNETFSNGGDADNTTFTLGDGEKVYSPRAPFRDATSNTLADVAFKYWATDLAPNLGNELKPSSASATSEANYWNPKNDPATWQHLVNFMIGLGLGEALDKPQIPWTGETYGGAGYENILNGSVSWPAADANNIPENIYDLWHAAVNSRGEFFSADDPDAMVQAFQKIIDRIGNFETSASSPSVTASVVEGATKREIYETQFSSEDWSGDLIKYTTDAQNVRTRTWSAQSQLDNASSRNIYMYSPGGTNNRKAFTWTNLSEAQQAFFNVNPDSTSGATDSKGQARFNYVRGTRTNEGTDEGTFRTRGHVLGDIVNSSPVVVAGAQYLTYIANRIEPDGDYAEFKSDAAERAPMVYVGANDGMLHGFNAETGLESFAYVPTAVIHNLNRLSGQTFASAGHRYYVDGTPVVSDVYFNNAWHTVLVGTLRGGGRSIFALDVTDPESIKVLWEFSSADDEDLGYTFPTPVVAKLHDGSWSVLMGNGYGNQTASTADKAALYVIDIATGSRSKIVVTGDSEKANGLSSVRAADNNSDGIADYAYAGDLQGNLWRFDLYNPSSSVSSDATDPFDRSLFTGTQASSFAASYNGHPMFSAVDGRDSGATAQPITSPPSLVRHPTQRGYLVIFGTGKYFEETDGNVDTSRAQSLYAIWDRKTRRQSTSTPTAITRTDLQQQTITTEATAPINGVSSELRLISQNSISWYKADATDLSLDSSVRKWGWYLDLQVGSVKSGEMMINPMSARGQSLFFATLTPNDDPCKDGVDSWLYGINPNTGGRTAFNVFDMDGNGAVDSNDAYNSSVISGRKISKSGGFVLSNDRLFSSGEDIMVDYGPTSSGRQTWQVIPDEDNEEDDDE